MYQIFSELAITDQQVTFCPLLLDIYVHTNKSLLDFTFRNETLNGRVVGWLQHLTLGHGARSNAHTDI